MFVEQGREQLRIWKFCSWIVCYIYVVKIILFAPSRGHLVNLKRYRLVYPFAAKKKFGY